MVLIQRALEMQLDTFSGLKASKSSESHVAPPPFLLKVETGERSVASAFLFNARLKFFEENVRDVSSACCQILTSLSSAGPRVQSTGL